MRQQTNPHPRPATPMKPLWPLCRWPGKLATDLGNGLSGLSAKNPLHACDLERILQDKIRSICSPNPLSAPPLRTTRGLCYTADNPISRMPIPLEPTLVRRQTSPMSEIDLQLDSTPILHWLAQARKPGEPAGPALRRSLIARMIWQA